MKKFAFAILALSLLAVSCGEGEKVDPLVIDFTISSNPVYAGEEVTFTASALGGVQPYSYSWAVGDAVTLSGESVRWTPEANGTFIVKLSVTDTKGTSVDRSKNLVVEPAPVVATGEVTLKWATALNGYTSITSPAVADDGSIYTATRDMNKFYKISGTDGSVIWEKPLLNNPQSGSQIYGTPAIDSDGTIYMCGGTKNGDATLVAFNPNGSEKWRFTNFWNKGEPHQAAINGGTSAGIGDKNVYIGNVGSSGTIITVSKADGSRVNYCMDANGGGPAGGCRGGVVLSRNADYVGWCGGSYGVFGASTATLDSPGEGTPWAWRACHSAASGWSVGNNQATIAAIQLNGKDLLVGMQAIKDNDSGKFIYEKVYGVDFATGEEVVNARIDACAQQDQGGISVTEDGLIIASLKYNLGADDGGIALVDPAKNEMVAHYRVAENVTSAPAVDQAGNIHFGTEAGNYYVVKYQGNGQFETLVKKDVAELVKNDSRYSGTYKETEVAKIWSGIVICDDGTILIQFTDNDNRALGCLTALSLDYTTGPSTQSQWPMMGQNRRHTNRQK